MQSQVPKVIHYCWFGNKPLPELAQKCIASWHRFLPDYEIREWNESSFNVYKNAYTAEAYRLKAYAHLSDYARFWILYHFGGVYFDTDVEVIRPLDDIIARGSFMGFECQEGNVHDNPNGNVNPGLGMAAVKGHPFIARVLEHYDHSHFARWNGFNTGNITIHVTRLLDYAHMERLSDGVVNVSGFNIYPIEYFCPLNYYTQQKQITGNTRTIHHYMASWKKKVTRWQNIRKRTKYILIRIRYQFFPI